MKNDFVNYLSLYKELYGDEIYLNSIEKKQPSKNSSNRIKLNTYLDSIRNCMECSLGKSRNKIVLGMGNPDADIVFVGELKEFYKGTQEPIKNGLKKNFI